MYKLIKKLITNKKWQKNTTKMNYHENGKKYKQFCFIYNLNNNI